MVSEVKITYEGKSILEAIRIAGDSFQGELGKTVLRAAQHFEGEIRRHILEKLTQDPTGQLMRSVRSEMLSTDGEIVGAIARPYKPYAQVQDEGKTIYPKKKFLAIPVKAPRGKWPRDYPRDYLTYIDMDGQPALFHFRKSKKTGKLSKKGRLMFLLYRQVTIEGVHYMEAAEQSGRPGAEKLFEEGISDLLKRAIAKAPEVKPDAS